MGLTGSHLVLRCVLTSCVTVISVLRKRRVTPSVLNSGCLCSEDTRPIADAAQLRKHGADFYENCQVVEKKKLSESLKTRNM